MTGTPFANDPAVLHSRGDASGSLHDALTALLGAAFSVTEDGDRVPAPDASLRPLMRSVVAEARAAGLYAEGLIRLVKERWWSLIDASPHGAVHTGGPVLSQLVTLCVEEFYRDHRPPSGDGGSETR